MMSISTKINSGTDHTCKLLEFYFIIECSTQLLMNRIYQTDGSFYNTHTLFFWYSIHSVGIIKYDISTIICDVGTIQYNVGTI